MRDGDLAFGGPMALPASRLCPVCSQALDVRRYPALEQAYFDCWACLITWEEPAAPHRTADVAFGGDAAGLAPRWAGDAEYGPSGGP